MTPLPLREQPSEGPALVKQSIDYTVDVSLCACIISLGIEFAFICHLCLGVENSLDSLTCMHMYAAVALRFSVHCFFAVFAPSALDNPRSQTTKET